MPGTVNVHHNKRGTIKGSRAVWVPMGKGKIKKKGTKGEGEIKKRKKAKIRRRMVGREVENE